MTQAIVPRPVAWVLSANADGSHNLAPFSYFNAICSDPPLVLLSVGWKSDGTPKDTRNNIEQRRYLVIHIAHAELLEALNASADALPAGESEVSRLALATKAIPGFPLPRLADCRMALGCELYRVEEIGNTRQALIFAEIRLLYVAKEVAEYDVRGRVKIDIARLAPIGRLGSEEYLLPGEVKRLRRPR
jgi:flavin reductase (DIM6/NTAB) family NADH-FMN oxidoreductase RutF